MRTWIVTGASRGLGRQLALQLAGRGDRVLAVARDAGGLQALAAHTDGRIVPVPLDLAEARAIRPMLEAAIAAAGGIDGAINNAGIGAYKPFLDHDEDELLRVLQVNLGAVMQVCRVVLPHLVARGGGQIINIGSDLGRRPLANMAPYVATKHGLLGLNHSLLREFRDRNVRVTLVNPGIIDTGFGGGEEGRGDGRGSLRPSELAAQVLAVLDAPPGIVIDEITLHPLGQGDF
ncbi:MAG: SDR family NAD(P)-dependent oxidoreductase [Xanthomonadaceae bacterium]|jgi:short-subunit dehydrogenase|nr:SDR family NAD(P)-dependent oxidoreductase [Xanthomonadaceae bacterium]